MLSECCSFRMVVVVELPHYLCYVNAYDEEHDDCQTGRGDKDIV